MLDTLRLYAQTITGASHPTLANLLLLLTVGALAVGFYYLTNMLLVLVEKAVERTPTKLDDKLLNKRFLRAVSQLAPACLVRWMLPGLFESGDPAMRWITVLTNLYIIASFVYLTIVLLSNIKKAMHDSESLREYASSSLFQAIYLVVIIIGIIVSISAITGRSPVVILTALGASAAVLMLVFRDTILGLVASVQLTANKMLKKGNWMIAEKHGANGIVEEINLTTVKVRNWDNSITTIPPYSLVSESFRNYEPMQTKGARRVERAVYIDASTVRFCTADELAVLADAGMLDGDGTKTVNLGLFRRHIEKWLSNHPDVITDDIVMVRQMDPTPSGLPVQLYFYTGTTEWIEYEHIQSDIFDHVYAVVSMFGLRIFQTPSGTDLLTLGAANAEKDGGSEQAHR